MGESVLRSEIQKRNRAFMSAVKAGDAAKVAASYTEDAWLLPPGADIIRGRARIEEFWRGLFERIAELNLTTVDVVALGSDTAREVGSAEITLKSGEAKRIPGKYIVVWKRVAGEWQLEADMFNNNA
jgi:uncharacterized protein (TIGR02246 family)